MTGHAMYGMVNKAVKELIVKNHDENTWRAIAKAAGADETFIGLDHYDDDVTYRLVATAAAHLDTSAESLLHEFGRHWIKYTATEGYGSFVDNLGDTLEEFLRNLSDDLHGRVAVTMPHLQPPEFETRELGTGQFEVHYKSHRTGLAPMVTGLLTGLAERYDTQASIEHHQTLSSDPAHEVYRVTIQ